VSRLLRVLVVTAALVILASLIVTLVWPLPALLTRHPSHGLTSTDRLKATNDARLALVTLVAGVAATSGLVFTGRTFLLSRASSIADRYGRAIEQLASSGLSIRMGGVFGLDALAIERRAVSQSIADVLGAFLREPLVLADGDTIPADRQVALSVIGRPHYRGLVRDLHGAVLQRAKIKGLDLSACNLIGADLTFSEIADTNLAMADLSHADLRGSTLVRTSLAGAIVDDTDLRGATLIGIALDAAQSAVARVN
jgi:Pentapeptide repeats (8 copies)